MLKIIIDDEIGSSIRMVAAEVLRERLEGDISALREFLWHPNRTIVSATAAAIGVLTGLELKEVSIREQSAGRRCKYEVHKAENKQKARQFLANIRVREEFYYVEVDTPEGVVGRDIEGSYET